MDTRVTDGARRERRPRFVRLAASPLARACTHLTKSEEKERLFAVYQSVEGMVFLGLIRLMLPSPHAFPRLRRD